MRSKARAHGGRSSPTQIYARVHEPHRQSGCVQDFASDTFEADPRSRVGNGSAAHLRSGAWQQEIPFWMYEAGEGVFVGRGHTRKVRGSSLEASDREESCVSAGEPNSKQAGEAWGFCAHRPQL